MIGRGVVFRPLVEGSQQCWLPCAEASNHLRSSTIAPSFGAISVANMYSHVAEHGQKLSTITSTGTSGAAAAALAAQMSRLA